jgi:hypothetical protein
MQWVEQQIHQVQRHYLKFYVYKYSEKPRECRWIESDMLVMVVMERIAAREI